MAANLAEWVDSCACRLPALTDIARAAMALNSSLAGVASGFISDPAAGGRPFFKGLASALATSTAFASAVAKNTTLAAMVTSTLPGGGDIPMVCAQLASSPQQKAALQKVYSCLCERTASSPPVVACIGHLALTGSKMFEDMAARAAAEPDTNPMASLGRKLSSMFQDVARVSPDHGQVAPRRQLQELDLEKLVALVPGCLNKASEFSMKKTFKKLKGTTCELKIKLPLAGTSGDCSIDGKPLIPDDMPTIDQSYVGSWLMNATQLGNDPQRKTEEFFDDDSVGFDGACSVTFYKVIDVEVVIGLQISNYFVMKVRARHCIGVPRCH